MESLPSPCDLGGQQGPGTGCAPTGRRWTQASGVIKRSRKAFSWVLQTSDGPSTIQQGPDLVLEALVLMSGLCNHFPWQGVPVHACGFGRGCSVHGSGRNNQNHKPMGDRTVGWAPRPKSLGSPCGISKSVTHGCSNSQHRIPTVGP